MDDTRSPPNTAFALPRNTTDFGFEVGRLVTYLRLGWAEDALREVALIEEAYQQDLNLHQFLVDDGLPSAFDMAALNYDINVLATLPPPHSQRPVQRSPYYHRARKHHPQFG